MISFIKKSLSYIITGSCSVVFAACYGPATKLENPKQINARNDDDEAIQGLKVTLFENREIISEQFTNKSGSVEFNFVQKDKHIYTALIEDIDGAENGSYQSKTVDLTSDSFVQTNLDKAE